MTWRLLISRRRELFAGLLASAVTLMFLTGGSATATFGLLLCAALFFASFVTLDSIDRRRARRTGAVTAVLIVFLSAPLWLDAVQHWGALDEAPPPARHLQLGGFLNILSPVGLGDLSGESPAALRSINQDADPLELVLYPGALPLFLMLMALFRPKRTYLGLFWVLAGGTGLLLALDSPLVDALNRLTGWGPALPGASLVLTHVACVVLASVAMESFFEAPTRRHFAVPLTIGLTGAFCAAVVVLGFVWQAPALGLLKWLGADGVQTGLAAGLHHLRFQLLVTAGFLAAIAGLFLTWKRLGILRFKAALAVVAFLDLLGVAMFYTPRIEGPTMTGAYASHLPETDGRVMTATRTPLPPAGWLMAEGFSTVPTAGKRILANTAAYLSLVDPSGVVGSGHVAPLFVPQLLDHPLLTCANVVLGVAPAPFQIDGHRPLTSRPGGETAASGLFVAERSTTLPRARVLFQTRSVSSDAEAGELLRLHPHILTETVVLEGDRQAFEPLRPGVRPTLEMDSDGANEVRLRAAMGQGRGYLLLADAMAPGWQVTVDGVRAQLLQADLAFRVVALPEGEHEVAFEYSPWMTRLGFPLLLFGLLLGIAWSMLAVRRMFRWGCPDVAQ